MIDCCCCGLITTIGVIVGLYILIKIYNYLTTGVFKGNERLDGKTAVVTGSDSGIGLVAAKDFARRGARVVMVCKEMENAQNVKEEIINATGNTKISLKHVDFLSLDSVRKCANEILAKEERIDILLNNAGVGFAGFGQTVDGLEIVMQVNYYAPFLFTNILLGKIKESAPSRIVNVCSLAYVMGKIDFNGGLQKSKRSNEASLYADSKLANILFSNELAHKLKGTNVTSNGLHPGVFASGIVRQANIFIRAIWFIMSTLFFKTIEEAAQTSIYLSVSPDVAKISGKYFRDCKAVELFNHAKDMGVAKKLWEVSERYVKLKPAEKHY